MGLTMLLSGLESLLVQNGSNGLFAGEAVTVADLAVWRAVDWMSNGTLDGIPRSYIPNTFPNLASLYQKVDALPEVQEWKQKNPRHYKRRSQTCVRAQVWNLPRT